jgi:hypothetical protein
MESTRCIVGLRVSDTRIEDAMGDIEGTNYKSISIANALDRGIRTKMNNNFNQLHACAYSVEDD